MTPASRLTWSQSRRVISTRFPRVDVFERVAKPADWDDLERLANLTNPRLKQSAEVWGMLPPEDCATGEGAELIMAPFAYPSPGGSRFADGTFGAYYAGRELNTAIDETVFHTEKFAREGRMPAIAFEKQVLEARISGSFHDLRKAVPDKKILSPDSYAASQRFALALKQEEKSQGIVYPSVRSPGGECIAVFMPRLISNCRRTLHLAYLWDGTRITAVQQRSMVKVLQLVRKPR
ncbi:MAG: RES family NAD+ phosphorylase [Usitatibacteraceae bacterium]